MGVSMQVVYIAYRWLGDGKIRISTVFEMGGRVRAKEADEVRKVLDCKYNFATFQQRILVRRGWHIYVTSFRPNK